MLRFYRLGVRLSLVIVMALAVFALIPVGNHHKPTTPTYAQSGDPAACDSLIQDALQKIANNCLDLGKNEICYGYNSVSAVLRDPALFFEAPGDLVPATAVETLITRPIDPASGEWGVALVSLQADLPQDTDGFVTLLLFGGVEVNQTADQVAADTPTCQVSNGSASGVTLYAGPGDSFPSVDILDRGDSLTVNGRNETGDWLRSPRGWVAAAEVTTSCDSGQLALMSNANDSYVTPMQSFTLRMDDAAQCQAAPSGLMVQTPSGQTASLRVNNIEIRMGSTAFLTVRDGNRRLTVANVGGEVRVTANGVTVELDPDTQTNVELDDEGMATGEPDEAEPLEGDIFDVEFDLLDEVFDTEDWDLFALAGCEDDPTSEDCETLLEDEGDDTDQIDNDDNGEDSLPDDEDASPDDQGSDPGDGGGDPGDPGDSDGGEEG